MMDIALPSSLLRYHIEGDVLMVFINILQLHQNINLQPESFFPPEFVKCYKGHINKLLNPMYRRMLEANSFQLGGSIHGIAYQMTSYQSMTLKLLVYLI